MEINPPPFSKKRNLSLKNKKLSKEDNFFSDRNFKKWWGVKKAVILAAGLGTRFLPLSKIIPKELLPLADKPMIQYTIEEAKASGISEIILVISPKNELILNYFKKAPRLEKILRERKKNHLLAEIKNLENIFQGIKFSFVFQRKPLGDGQAVLLTEKFVKKEPFLVLYPDDIVQSKISCSKRLIEIFKTYKKPVMAISRISKEKVPFYGIVAGKKIAKRIYEIKEIVEKPSIEKAPSNLAIVGKRIITPEVFDYLKRAKPSQRGEIGLTDVLAEMVEEGKKIYGYEIEGKWLECGNKILWLKSNLYLSLKNPRFGKELKNFIKKENLV